MSAPDKPSAIESSRQQVAAKSGVCSLPRNMKKEKKKNRHSNWSGRVGWFAVQGLRPFAVLHRQEFDSVVDTVCTKDIHPLARTGGVQGSLRSQRVSVKAAANLCLPCRSKLRLPAGGPKRAGIISARCLRSCLGLFASATSEPRSVWQSESGEAGDFEDGWCEGS